ncbi:MAG: DUF4105 domain-containing protein, partial [Burkholderiales bacterium]|nr:DUF4105 domain-containing protein [Burkholderiales bacterium]
MNTAAKTPARQSPASGLPVYAGMLGLSMLLAGCEPWQINTVGDRLMPSNFRDWSPEYARLPRAEMEGTQLTIRNIRDNQYLSEKDFVPRYYDRTIDVDDIQSVDFIVVPFKQMPSMAHTMLSFGLADGSYLGVSAEIRTERGETYSPILGMSNQYEITYVVADERDLLRLHARHRNADVYVYPTVANARQAQALFLDCMQRANQLADRPEFYHPVANNCTTNILRHVNQIRDDEIPQAWEVLLPGHS